MQYLITNNSGEDINQIVRCGEVWLLTNWLYGQMGWIDLLIHSMYTFLQ